MSIVTWLDEFYPKTVYDLSDNLTDLECIDHSILKWSGALPENLEKHNVIYASYAIRSDETNFTFDGHTCALCQIYRTEDYGCYNPELNKTCPIVRVLQRCCDQSNRVDSKRELSIYDQSRDTPEPMINLLQQTREYVLKEGKV